MLALNNSTFKTEVLDSDKPVLVDFHAIGCGPCRSLKPILDGMVDKIPTIKFAAIEASEGMDVFGEYGVGRVPTMILFKDGKKVDSKGGLMSEKDITEWINSKVN